MANGHGGPRTPRDPAPVSGPGRLSARTDGGPGQPVRVASGGEYGSRQEMEQIQSSAPMAEAGGMSTPPPGPPPTRPPGLGDPTARPDEPVTAGSPLGDGIGPAAAGIKSPMQATNEQLRPMIRSLERVANLPNATPETRLFLRMLKARTSDGMA